MHLLVYHHFLLFAIAIVASALVTSAAAWNVVLVPDGPRRFVDEYMIFLGASGLLVLVPLLFLDLFAYDPLTSAVWAEAAWVGLLLLLSFPGSVATSVLHADDCRPTANALSGFTQPSACTSSQLLQAFAWISTINLLLYFVNLVASAAFYARTDPSVWHANVRRYDWCAKLRCVLRSAPSSPARPTFNTDFFVAAPQPRHAIDPAALRSPALEARYQIEHLSETVPDLGLPFDYVPQRAPPHAAPVGAAPPALYPFHVQSALGLSTGAHTSPTAVSPQAVSPLSPRAPSKRQSSHARYDRTKSSSRRPERTPSDAQPGRSLVQHVERSTTHAPADPIPLSRPTKRTPAPAPREPEPLGDWPRRDIMQQPRALPRARTRDSHGPTAAPSPHIRRTAVPAPAPLAADPATPVRTSIRPLPRRTGDPEPGAVASSAPSAFPSALASPTLAQSRRPSGPRGPARSSLDSVRRPSLDGVL